LNVGKRFTVVLVQRENYFMSRITWRFSKNRPNFLRQSWTTVNQKKKHLCGALNKHVYNILSLILQMLKSQSNLTLMLEFVIYKIKGLLLSRKTC